MIGDVLKVLLGIFMGFIIGFTSISAGYYTMRHSYFDCQIKYSGKIEFQSGFAERLFER